MVIYFTCITINLTICFLDVALFFEEDKVKNYLYYTQPVFVMRKYNSIGLYFIVNGISTIIFVMMAVNAWMPLGIISYWSMVWYNELILLRDELNTAMQHLDVYFGERGNRGND